MTARLLCAAFALCMNCFAGAQQTRIAGSPLLPLAPVKIDAHFPDAAEGAAGVSWLAVRRDGKIYELQRGDKAPPILLLDANGQVLQKFGTGEFTLPHCIRIDRDGSLWTVDAGTSTVTHFSAAGQKLSSIVIGEMPDNGSPFRGATDVAFAPNGHLLISDGYGNNRILEYTRAGKRVRQWGTAGAGESQLNLPHAIAVDDRGHIFVADRENGRIQEFTQAGHFVRAITGLGRVYCFAISGSVLWVSSGPTDQPPGSPGGWVSKLDLHSGALLGHVDVPNARAGHAIDVTSAGEPVITAGDSLILYRAR